MAASDLEFRVLDLALEGATIATVVRLKLVCKEFKEYITGRNEQGVTTSELRDAIYQASCVDYWQGAIPSVRMLMLPLLISYEEKVGNYFDTVGMARGEPYFTDDINKFLVICTTGGLSLDSVLWFRRRQITNMMNGRFSIWRREDYALYLSYLKRTMIVYE